MSDDNRITIYVVYSDYPEGRMDKRYYATEEEAYADSRMGGGWAEMDEIYIPIDVLQKAIQITTTSSTS